MLLLVGGLLLPNALALVAGLVAGVPPRTSAIALYAALGLLAGRIPGWLLGLLCLPVLILDVVLVIDRMFFLGLPVLVDLIDSRVLVGLLASPLYAGLALALLGSTAAYLAFMVRAGAAMRRGSRPVFAAAAAALLIGDAVLNGSAAYDFGPLASAAKPFESASIQSGFDALPDQTRPPRRVLLVMVESLGVLRDPAQRAVLTAPFEDPALRQLYAVATGTSPFFGATASGEMRELCRTYGGPRQLLGGEDPACLPERFAARGYRTAAVHGFHAGFYDRARWYPQVGFQRSLFGEALAPRFARRCPGPFPGPCDTDLVEAVGAEMREGQASFVYWLTLNSHVPVPGGLATPRLGCGRPGSVFADAEVCAMVEIWQDLFGAVARLALAHPGTEILLVGDHAPPLWRRAAREGFEPGQVAWIRLSPLPVATAALP
ncbi:sulfatase-like hydrolase/transferase [Methylobacterium nonmethylotrophicum]|nr:sulfatase-like hydrolase/transferase [Methylobacterium nonmethylotrophicum]